MNNHIKSQKHQNSNANQRQPQIHSSFQDTEEVNMTNKNYSMNLSKAFIEAGIPLWKLTHPSLEDFFKKEHNRQLPTYQSLYDNVDKIYMKCVN